MMGARLLQNFFRRIPDSEGKQATIRAFLCPLSTYIYLHFVPEFDGPWRVNHEALDFIVVLYAAFSFALLAALALDLLPAKPRRIGSLVLDASAVTGLMLFTHQYGIAIFGFYMWVCLGYGLRYGVAFLRLAQTVTVDDF